MAALSLQDIVNISVNLSPRSSVRKGFNLGLILGSSQVICPQDRVKIYSSLDAMAEDGFNLEMPEYRAASLYFAQAKAPTRIAVGRYAEEEETLLDAVRDCREKNTDWYFMTDCGATRNEILDLAQYMETAVPSSIYGFASQDAEALTGGQGSVFAALKAFGYQRTLGQFSRTPDAVAGIMGYAMGANTKTSHSAFTLMHKSVPGLSPDALDATQVDFLSKANANYYVSRGADGEYALFENGVMVSGAWFDEILNLDMLVNDIQRAILDLMKSRPSIPQTEAGISDIKLAIKPCLETMRKIGFIAPGPWNGPDLWLTSDYCALETGDRLTDGYLILSEPVDAQSQADRDARMAPPIYTPIKLAGAVHTALVQIDVNR